MPEEHSAQKDISCELSSMDSKLKTGLISIAALIGGYTFLSKKTIYPLDAETFMAGGNMGDTRVRARAMSNKKITSPSKFNYLTNDSNYQWAMNFDNMVVWERADAALLGKEGAEFEYLRNVFNWPQYFAPIDYPSLTRNLGNSYTRFIESQINDEFDSEKYKALIGNVADALEKAKKDPKYEIIWRYNQNDAVKVIMNDANIIDALDSLEEFVLGGKSNSNWTYITAKVGTYGANRNYLSNLNSLFGDGYNSFLMFDPNEELSRKIVLDRLEINKDRMGRWITLSENLFNQLVIKNAGNDIEGFADYLLDNFSTKSQTLIQNYISVVYWNSFFQANPSITYVGISGDGYEMKFYDKENIYSNNELYPIYDYESLSKVFTEEKATTKINTLAKRFKELCQKIIAKEKRGAKSVEGVTEECDKFNRKSIIDAVNKKFADKSELVLNVARLTQGFNTNTGKLHEPLSLYFPNTAIPFKTINKEISPSGRVSYAVVENILPTLNFRSGNTPKGMTLNDFNIPKFVIDATEKEFMIQRNHKIEQQKITIEQADRNIENIIKNGATFLNGLDAIK